MNKCVKFLIVLAVCISWLPVSAQFKTIRIGKQLWMADNMNTDIPGSYVFNGKAEFEKKFGRLYTYEAAKKVCPSGWRLPSDNDWNELCNAVGGEDIAAKALKVNGNSGFKALAGGYANGSSFWFIEVYGGFWSSTSYDADHAWYVFFTNKDDAVTKTYFSKNYGFSVRCLKN